jgi:Secretin and TonB N terminus short domain
MKSLPTVLACLGLLCAASPALAQVQVNVAAGDLADAVESLGKQSGVNVIYPGDLLEGRTTAGVSGTLSPEVAFAILLEGTSLAATQESGAMRIAQAPPPRLVAASPGAVETPVQVPAKSAQVPETTTCRNVSSLTGVVQSMCGTPAQWAEFDSGMAKLDKGFSCKPMKGSVPLCLFAKQWQHVERNRMLRGNTLQNGFGDGAQRSAMAIENSEYNAVRQDLIDSSNGQPSPILAP